MRKIKFLLFALLAAFSAIFLNQPDAAAVFSIDLNFYAIDFGSLNMGDIKDDVPGIGLKVTCRTNQGNPWRLKIRTDRPFANTANPASVIPNTNFFWYGISSSVSGNNSLDKNQEDFTIERTVYSAPAGEGAAGTDIVIKFKIVIPKPVQSGMYTSKIIFTFTE